MLRKYPVFHSLVECKAYLRAAAKEVDRNLQSAADLLWILFLSFKKARLAHHTTSGASFECNSYSLRLWDHHSRALRTFEHFP